MPKRAASYKKIRETISGNPALESLIYVVAGVVLALVVYKGMGVALGTSDPIVTVMSYSMIPTLDRGDLVVLRGANVSDLVEGEKAGRANGSIIVYWQPQQQRLIIHRLWKINEDGTLQTWGDNVASPDPWAVQPSWVKGQAAFRIPFLGWPRIMLGEMAATFR